MDMMVSRRGALAGLAALWACPSWGQEGPLLSRPGGDLLPLGDPGSPRDPLILAARPPWVQVLRTFGNPVLEGHFAIRVSAQTGAMCVAMWDLGDRVLGLGQQEGMDRGMLWDLVAVAMGRKPDIAIGRPDALYESDHFESAHWRLDADTAQRIGRARDAQEVQARRWVVPAAATAEAIEPLTRALLPPRTRAYSHVLWHEPMPRTDTGSRLARDYRLGEIPNLDRTLAAAMRAGRMLAPLETRTAERVLARNGGPALMAVADRDGTPLGRVRVLIV